MSRAGVHERPRGEHSPLWDTKSSELKRIFSLSTLAAIILTHNPAIPTWVKADLEDAVGNESLCSSATISSVLHSFILGGFHKIYYLSA